MKALVLEVAKYCFLCRMEDGHKFYLDKNALPSELRNLVNLNDVLIVDKKVHVDRLVS